MKLIGLIFFSFFIFLSNSKDLKITKDRIELSVDMKTTSLDFDRYKSLLHKKNINLNVFYISYNKNKTIREIEIRVDCNDGFKGTVRKKLYLGTKLGFIRDYSKNTSEPFKVF